MAGSVIENLSNRKLFVILMALFLMQLAFFLLGAIFAPDPSSSMEFLMSRCKDKSAGKSNEWVHIRPLHCDLIDRLDDYRPVSADVRDIVFVAQMPHARAGVALQYSPWFQYLIGFLDVEIEYNPAFKLHEETLLELEIRMAYRNVDDPEEKWTEYISTTVQRPLSCKIDPGKRVAGFLYNCTVIDLFELGANNYPFYLLNIRIPVNASRCQHDPNAPNCAIGRINELRLIAAHQNGGFTMVWLWLKTLVTPVVVASTWWYYRRVAALNRPMLLVEKSILALGCALIVLDVPIEWLFIYFRFSLLLLFGDLRQGAFYTVLFAFWLIFAGEHLIDDRTRNNFRNYWRNLSLVGLASTTLLLYDMAERGQQLIDPFFTVWGSPRGTFWARFGLYMAAILIAVYFFFLCYKIWMVWTTIKRKRASQYYHLNEGRRLKVEAIIYRFKFLMILTVVCAFSTIVSYWMQQYDESQFLDDELEPSRLFTHSASAFFTGTFGMWNIYVCLLLYMYAPSHKHYANAHVLEDENEDLMDPNSTIEFTPMTAFLKPATD